MEGDILHYVLLAYKIYQKLLHVSSFILVREREREREDMDRLIKGEKTGLQTKRKRETEDLVEERKRFF